MKKYFTLTIMAALTALISAGCYTIYNHPGDEEGHSYSAGATDCVRCHPDYHEDFGYSHYSYPDYWITYDRWGQFYAIPWWWDYYWYSDDNYYNDDNYTPRSSHGEPAVRPASRFEAVPEASVSGITRGGSSGSTSSGATTTTKESTESGTKAETKTKEIKTKDAEPERKATRRSGRWKTK